MIATYRGVKYDTDKHANKVCQTKNVQETYRGVKHDEQVRICK